MNNKLLYIITALYFASTGCVKAQAPGRYDWISHARIFIIDGYTYPLMPKLEFDAEKLAETMADMHANVLRIATSGYCDWLIPGTQFKTSAYLGDRDILDECIKACKPRGIKVVPYLRTGGPIRTEIMDPEWVQRITPDGKPCSYWDLGDMASPTCWNTSYRDAFYDYVKIIVNKYDIDGIYFDSWFPFYGFNGPVCYCEGCKRGFRKASGKEIPYKANPKDYTPEELKDIESYRTWYRNELAGIFTVAKKIVKSYKDIPLIYNINNPSRIINEDTSILNGSDAFLYERGRTMAERAEGVSLATAHGLAVWPYAGTYDPFPRIPHYNHELVQEIYTTVAFGGSPVLYHTYFFAEHPESRGLVRDAFTILDRNDMFVKGFRSDEFCAVVWSNTDPPGHEVKAFVWNNNARMNSLGAFTACMNSHIQVSSLLQMDLDNFDILKKYKVLYLPDICYLSDKQVENITRFVEEGGGLVMTYATSLYNEKGERRTDFALGSLAKIRYKKPDEGLSVKISKHQTYGGVWDLYLKTRQGQEIIKSPLAGRLIPTHLYETVEVLPGGKIVADLVSGTGEEPIVPGLIVSGYGKGKVAYLAGASDALYYQTSMKELSDLMTDVIKYVSPSELPYEIEAPRNALISNMTVNGNTRVFHLINWSGSKDEKMLQNVYYIPSLEDIKIRFRIPEGKKVREIKLFVPGEFSQKKSGDILSVNILKLNNYQGVIIELE